MSYTGEPTFIAVKLRELMRARNMSGHKLAVACGVTDRTVWRWKRGETTPDAEHLAKIVAALEVDASEFRPALISMSELGAIETEMESLRRLAAQASAENSELRSHLERLQASLRTPQEMLKPNAQRKAADS